jgi:AAA15 family ATPase/GTPase
MVTDKQLHLRMPMETIHSKTQYGEILFPEDSPFSNYSCEGSRGIGPLSLVNIFIGVNNSGKSRLLRSLFFVKDFSYTTNKYKARAIYELIRGLKPEFDAIFGENLTTFGNVSLDNMAEVLSLDSTFISPNSPINVRAAFLLRKLADAQGGGMSGQGPFPSKAEEAELACRLRALGEKGLDHLAEIDFDLEIGNEKRYYVPILRGMRPLDREHTNLYKNRTYDDYFENEVSPDKIIFTGLELYLTLKKKLLGEPEERESVARFEQFLSRKFFRSERVTLIPFEGDTTVRVKIGNEKQLPIYQLGDGLQGLIICTFNIFMETERCLFFIEEPDMCMHPSMQRSFLEVLSEFDHHQYFLTSHSNHLLDMTLDFSRTTVFHFSKLDDEQSIRFQIRAASTRDSNLLLDLGVRNSSVFLSNSTIWVEGITDRLYLRAYMMKYVREQMEARPDFAKSLRRLKEDYDYSFVEYQGANLTHWSFDPSDEDTKRIKASFMCAHAFLIADGDVKTKGTRQETYEAMLGNRFLVLPTREIENLLPPEVLKKLVLDAFHENKKSTEEIRYEEYSQEHLGLGAYLDSLLGVRPGASIFADQSGTIKSTKKTSFCEKAIAIMSDPEFDWKLTTNLKSICERVFDHILAENQHFSDKTE